MCFTISISACIDRIGQDLVDGGIGGGDPLDLGGGIGLPRKGKILGAQPEPDLTDRARFGELLEDAVNGLGDSLIRMEEDLAVVFAPEKADRESPA